MLWHNFNQRYYGNRAPLGLYLHAGQLWDPERRSVLHYFLKNVLQNPNVWVITARGLIEWMRVPVPIAQMPQFFAKECPRGGCTPADFPSSTASETETPDAKTLPRLFPHPVPDQATLVWTVTRAGTLELDVFDLVGRRVLHQVQPTAAGEVRLTITLRDQPPGLYVYRLTAPDGSSVRGELVHQ